MQLLSKMYTFFLLEPCVKMCESWGKVVWILNENSEKIDPFKYRKILLPSIDQMNKNCEKSQDYVQSSLEDHLVVWFKIVLALWQPYTEQFYMHSNCKLIYCSGEKYNQCIKNIVQFTMHLKIILIYFLTIKFFFQDRSDQRNHWVYRWHSILVFIDSICVWADCYMYGHHYNHLNVSINKQQGGVQSD